MRTFTILVHMALVSGVVMMVAIMCMLTMIMLMTVPVLVFVTPRFVPLMIVRFHFFSNIFSIFNVVLTLYRIEGLLILGDQMLICLLVYQLQLALSLWFWLFENKIMAVFLVLVAVVMSMAMLFVAVRVAMLLSLGMIRLKILYNYFIIDRGFAAVLSVGDDRLYCLFNA